MSISMLDGLLIAVFSMTVVFSVLCILYLVITALSKTLNKVGMASASNAVKQADKQTEVTAPAPAAAATDKDINTVSISTGELKLINVDEKTAALIMAIVSHESQIPLSELCFKSIRALEE